MIITSNASCWYSFCPVGSYKVRLNTERFKECPRYLQMRKKPFKVKGTQQKNKTNQDDGHDVDRDDNLDEDEINERESEEYLENDVSKIIVSGDNALIKTGMITLIISLSWGRIHLSRRK